MKKSHLGCIAACLLAGTLSAPVFAVELSSDVQSDSLRNGDHWTVVGAGVSGTLDTARDIRGNIRLEEETRNLGTTQRATVTGSMKVAPETAIELSMGAGSGASYGLRQQGQVAVYTSVGPVELYTGIGQVHYEESTVTRVFADARLPLGSGWTGLVGGATNEQHQHQVGHFTKVGVEYASGICTTSLLGYYGSEAIDASNPGLGVLPSKTVSLGTQCKVTSQVSLGLSANHTDAEALTRNGVFARVSFSY